MRCTEGSRGIAVRSVLARVAKGLLRVVAQYDADVKGRPPPCPCLEDAACPPLGDRLDGQTEAADGYTRKLEGGQLLLLTAPGT